MRFVQVDNFDQWRARARELLGEAVAPEEVVWADGRDPQGTLPLGVAAEPRERRGKTDGPRLFIPREFLAQAQEAACHRDRSRWDLLYRLAWRMTLGGERDLPQVAVDPDVHRLHALVQAVRQDAHRMRAFVRFQKISAGDLHGPASQTDQRYAAWYKPDHRVLRRVAPFFAARFADMRWTIFTPGESADWDGRQLEFGPGVPENPLAQRNRGATEPADDLEVESLWKTYYEATFNPTRTNVQLMRQHMPRRFWENLPEADVIENILNEAPRQIARMAAAKATGHGDARQFIPATATSLLQLKEAIVSCRACELCANATQPVFGEGPADARLILVGEQPGDEEDRSGRPFVGPAGRLLDEALASAGIDRTAVYVTNTVKAFRFVIRGQRRMHDTPRISNVRACRPWLESELRVLQPDTIVCLGAVATKALVGPDARITRDRGRLFTDTQWAPRVLVTEHPSAILRADPSARQERFEQLVMDLRKAATQ